MKIRNDTSGWFGVEHVSGSRHIDLFRFIDMETLCRLYPELFNPQVWLSDTPPKPVLPKKRKFVKRKK